MSKKVKRVGFGVGSFGVSELSRKTGLPLDPYTMGETAFNILMPNKPKKPGSMPSDTTEQAIAASRATEIEERRKRRVSLITSPGGAFLKATDLSKPSLTLGS